ncbi:hypothetical protein Tco_1343600 [Tanacetum coccineum]
MDWLFILLKHHREYPKDGFPLGKKLATDDSAMQDEIHEFDRLGRMRISTTPDSALIIASLVDYKVKLDEYGDCVENMARLVAKRISKKHDSFQMDCETAFLNGSELQQKKSMFHHTGRLCWTKKQRPHHGTSLWVFVLTKRHRLGTTHTPDADHAGCQDTHRSTSGSAQFLSDKLVSCSSKKQTSTSISSTEAEYIAMSGCCRQKLWMRSSIDQIMALSYNHIS